MSNACRIEYYPQRRWLLLGIERWNLRVVSIYNGKVIWQNTQGYNTEADMREAIDVLINIDQYTEVKEVGR